MEQENLIRDPQTDDFNFGKHALNALIGALYYLLLYIPFVLPFQIWGKAATRISHVWEAKTLKYNEGDKIYPLHTFYFNYVINFLLDAAIFLAWIVGFLQVNYEFFIDGEAKAPFVEGYVMPLFMFYLSVIVLKASKEIIHFFLNNLVVWIFDVIKAIGRFWVHIWGLNLVIKRKD
jgi:hypothetical protein